MRMLVSNVKPLVNPRLIAATRQFSSARKLLFSFGESFRVVFVIRFLKSLINAITFAIVTLLFSSLNALSREKKVARSCFILSIANIASNRGCVD